MPVKTLAMRRLKGEKRTFYCDEHGGYRHEYVDFYPAELVEKIIDDLSNQVLEERKKWDSLFEQFKARRKKLHDDQHRVVVALHNLQLAFATQQRCFYEMEAELCKHNGTGPTKAMANLRYWTRVRNSLAYRETKEHNGTNQPPVKE